MLLVSAVARPSDFEATAFGSFPNLAFYALILLALGVRALRSQKKSCFGPAAIFSIVYWIFVAGSLVITISSNGFATGSRDIVIALLFVIDVSLGLLWAIVVLRRSIVDGAWERNQWTSSQLRHIAPTRHSHSLAV
jgi:hypothetical protein